jgi:Sulfatase
VRSRRYISDNLSLGIVLTMAWVMTASVAFAQHINGVPGSPGATITLDGKQLPPPPLPFGGVIKESAKDSKRWWPPRVVPPKGAPNILLIMTDDQGYGVSSTFGGVIPTPALDRIAKAGLRYTQFHSTALCSPTRAALITGRNHHSVGFGVIGEMSTGYPHTIPILMSIDETFDVGIDTRTPVNDSYKLPFRFTGTIDRLTFNLGPEQLTDADRKIIAERLARAKD